MRSELKSLSYLAGRKLDFHLCGNLLPALHGTTWWFWDLMLSRLFWKVCCLWVHMAHCLQEWTAILPEALWGIWACPTWLLKTVPRFSWAKKWIFLQGQCFLFVPPPPAHLSFWAPTGLPLTPGHCGISLRSPSSHKCDHPGNLIPPKFLKLLGIRSGSNSASGEPRPYCSSNTLVIPIN